MRVAISMVLAAACAASDPAAPSYFATDVVSFRPGECAGFGADKMPAVVLGPPRGTGELQGSFDVVSLGKGGEIVLGFATAIIDGPGPDFLVFENAFYAGGDPTMPNAEPAEVSVSEDGTTWTTFSCTATTAPYGSCAGWHPTLSSPDNAISPRDPKVAGGDAFDLADLKIARARFVRIVDRSAGTCGMTGVTKLNSLGFDLDAVAIVHAE
jgi:hypothetical protein